MNMNGNDMVLDRIEPDFNLEYIAARLRQWSACSEKTLLHMALEAKKTARPKAAFKICRIEGVSDLKTVLNGIPFSGRYLSERIAGMDTVFAYIATEGNELAEWSFSYSGAKSAFARIIRYSALMLAEAEIIKALRSRFGLGPILALKPGRPDAYGLWPLDQQAPLFELLSPLPDKIGVSLRADFWMSPSVAASGLLIQAEQHRFHG
jgi:hypothetical protein